MKFVTTEDRVDRLEALFGQFLTEMAVLNKRADERNKAAEERQKLAEERHREAEERQKLAEERHREAEDRFARFQTEMAAINQRADERNRAAELRHQAAEERNRLAEERMSRFETEMREFKDEMREFKDEMRRSKRELDKKWGDLANKMGTILEDVVVPNLPRIAREHFQLETVLDFMIRRSRRCPDRPERVVEFDALVVGADAVLLGEAKSTPKVGSAAEFAEKIAVFFDFFPEYRGRRLIPVFGSWAIPDPVIERLTERGIYALRMGEDTMELANAAALAARETTS
ncbi:MAG TPA: hypothetical protein VI136_26855 [Verrucomicrobiae bacterium]